MNAITIVGLVLTVLGAISVVAAQFQRPPKSPPKGQEAALGGDEIAKILDSFNKLLDKLEKQYRAGICLIAAGIVFVAIGTSMDAQDAKDKAEEATASTLVLGV